MRNNSYFNVQRRGSGGGGGGGGGGNKFGGGGGTRLKAAAGGFLEVTGGGWRVELFPNFGTGPAGFRGADDWTLLGNGGGGGGGGTLDDKESGQGGLGREGGTFCLGGGDGFVLCRFISARTVDTVGCIGMEELISTSISTPTTSLTFSFFLVEVVVCCSGGCLFLLTSFFFGLLLLLLFVLSLLLCSGCCW